MTVDAQRVQQLVQSLNQIWSAPLQICVAIYFLYVTMGVAVMAGLGMLILLVPLNLLIARLVRKIQVKLLLFNLYEPIARGETLFWLACLIRSINRMKAKFWPPRRGA